MKVKRLAADMTINIIASLIPVAVLQLFVMPELSEALGSERYGLVITLLAIFNIIPSTLGNALNNIRLLHEEEYRAKKLRGDFNRLLLYSQLLGGAALIVAVCIYMPHITVPELLLTLLLAVAWMYREYHCVCFRIALNFKRIMLDNIILACGFLLGWLLFRLCGVWQLVYLTGYVCSALFISWKSKLVTEPFRRTPLFRRVLSDNVELTVSNLIARGITYADKLLLYPLLGGTMVSIYYAASVFTKITALAITPITSVILSYLAKMERCPKNVYRITLTVAGIICAVGSGLCILLARPVLLWVYPQYVEQALQYVPVICISMALATMATIINPFVLKFISMKWQIVTNAVTLLFYLLVSLVLLKHFALLGFCYGVLLTNALKMVVLLCIYRFKRTREEEPT